MNRKANFPIIITEVYLSISLLLFEFGPIKFSKTSAELSMIAFALIFQVMLLLGYIFGGIKQGTFSYTDEYFNKYNIKKVNKLITIALALSILFSSASFVRYVGSFSLADWIKFLIDGFRSSGEAYIYNMTINYSSIFTKLSTLLVGFYYIGIPLGIYFYKDLKKSNKVILILAVILEIGSYIIRGTNIGIFRVILSIICVIFVKREIKTEKKRIYIIIAGFFFLYYFVTSTASRMGGMALPTSLFGIPVDLNHGISAFVPASLKYAFLSISSYISQGYNGMMHAMDYPFLSTYGIGNSVFLLDNITFIDSNQIYQRTYIYRISGIWSDRINWSTAYTWFANDISFFGVIPLMFLVGFLFRKVVDSILKKDLYAILLLPLYMQFFLFLPCNNSVLSNPYTFMPFVFLHIIWFLKAKCLRIVIGRRVVWSKDLFRVSN